MLCGTRAVSRQPAVALKGSTVMTELWIGLEQIHSKGRDRTALSRGYEGPEKHCVSASWLIESCRCLRRLLGVARAVAIPLRSLNEPTQIGG